ncbi:MAG: hypothetical protein LBR74_04670 [Eubacterium sp.]|nr:hypothetical protein [Eubacterium sp.]
MDVESKINIHIAEQKEEGWEVVSLNSSGCFVCVLFEQLPPKASTLSDQFK